MAIDEGLLESLGEIFLGKKLIGKDDDLVTTLLMEFNEVLAGDELVRVAHIEHLLLELGSSEVFFVEVGGHLAPDFNALHVRQVALLR